jgi:hypothetical protein
VRPAARRMRAQGLLPPRLIPPAEIGHPDLPRQRERPRVSHPGAFCFRPFAKGFFQLSSRLHRAPRSIRTCWSEAGKAAKRIDALCLDASARAAADAIANELASSNGRPMRNIARTVRSGAGSGSYKGRPARCARRCRGVCRGSGEGVPRWKR